MRHAVFGRKFSRTKNERRRLLQGLARDLVLRGSITTTLPKAKAVQPLVEQLVTRAKRGGDVSRRALFRVIDDKRIVDQLLADAKTRFGSRTSGFTRIIKLGQRIGDAAEKVLLQFVDERVVAEMIAPKKEESRKAGSFSARKPVGTKETAPKRGRPKKSSK